MKYFITDTGLQPFDLSAQDIIRDLKDNMLPGSGGYSEKHPIKIHEMESTVSALMASPCYLFKHPDMHIKTLLDLHIKPTKDIVRYKPDKYLTVVTSFTREINSTLYYSTHLIFIDENLFDSWVRIMIIDGILNDLSK